MLKNKIIIYRIILYILFFSFQLKLFPQNGIINNIQSEFFKDYLQISYKLYCDTSSRYDLKFCIKDSSDSNFALFPKVIKGHVGIGKYISGNNSIIISKDQLPNDLTEDIIKKRNIYFTITAAEVADEINFRDLDKLSKRTESYLKEGVAVIIGIEDNLAITSFAKESAELFSKYCFTVLDVPFEKINYKINKEANRYALEPIFRKDGWLHNNITDGLSDAIIYFAGSSVLSEKNHSIYLLPFGAKTYSEGFSLDELISNLEGFNPASVTIFIEACILNDFNNQSITNFYFYPNNISGKINLVMACKGDEKNYSIEKEKMGLFTYEILNGLSGASDLNKDKNITFRELYGFIKKNVWDYSVTNLRKEQDPILIPSLELIGEKAERILLKFK